MRGLEDRQKACRWQPDPPEIPVEPSAAIAVILGLCAAQNPDAGGRRSEANIDVVDGP